MKCFWDGTGCCMMMGPKVGVLKPRDGSKAWLNAVLGAGSGCRFWASDGTDVNGQCAAFCLRLGLRHEVLTSYECMF
jgi:hypothetical protein